MENMSYQVGKGILEVVKSILMLPCETTFYNSKVHAFKCFLNKLMCR